MELFSRRPITFYYPHELEREKRKLSEPLADKKAADSQPVAALLGGQPASGKTGLIRAIKKTGNADYEVINGDEYRKLHPCYQEIQAHYGLKASDITQPFSNALVEFIKAECLRRKLSFIIEGTMRSYEKVIEPTATQARRHGFRVEAHVLAIHSDDSYLGIFQRYEYEMAKTGRGRLSPRPAHDEAYRQIPINVQRSNEQQLFDQIRIYSRDQTDSLQVTHTAPIDGLVDYPVLFAQLRQPLRSASFYRAQWKALETQALQRGETNPEYLEQIRGFCSQYT